MPIRCTTLCLALVLAPALTLGRDAIADGALASGVGAPSHAGTWTLDLRYPWTVQWIPHGALLGLGGLGLDGGLHLTEHLYAGASVESAALTRFTGEDDVPGAYGRLRAGGEARLYLNEDAETRDWLGARYGVETFDEGTTIGRFAELTIASELVMDGVGVGISISGGVSREPPSVFGDPAAASGAALARAARGTSASAGATASAWDTCPFVGLSVSVVFD